MDFIKSLFKFLMPLLFSAIAIAESPQYPHIEPIDIPEKVLESYRRLVDQRLFHNITDYLLNRVRYVSEFYIKGYDLLIPEYAAVINFLIIEYLNNVHPRDGEDFSLERKVYSELVRDIENFRESALNNTETSINSDHYPYNLKYSKVIDFLVRTALIDSQAMEEPNQKALFENLILNNASLNINHFSSEDYYNYYDYDLGTNFGSPNLAYRKNEIGLLKNIFKPTNWMLPNETLYPDTPRGNNIGYWIFYFIHASDNQTNRDFLNFPEFRRVEGSHFLHIPSLDALKRKGYNNLWRYTNHDRSHLRTYIEQTLPIDLLIALNSPNKETAIPEYLNKESILQGSIWNSLDEFFKDRDSENLVDMTGGLESFIYWFFNKQHEKASTPPSFNNFSATSYKSIFSFLKHFYTTYNHNFMKENISLEDFTNSVKSHFNKHLEKNYPQYLSEHFLP